MRHAGEAFGLKLLPDLGGACVGGRGGADHELDRTGPRAHLGEVGPVAGELLTGVGLSNVPPHELALQHRYRFVVTHDGRHRRRL